MEQRLRVRVLSRLAVAAVVALLLLVNTVEAFPRASPANKPTRANRSIGGQLPPTRLADQSACNSNSRTNRRSGNSNTGSSSSTAITAKFKDFEEMLDSFHEEAVLVLFTSINCGPCKLQKKELAVASKAVGNGFKMFAIDTEKWPHVGSRFNVGTLPCLVVVKEGVELVRLEGLTKAEEVVARVRTFL